VDTESAVLASTAAATMVTLLTTDAWAQAKKEIGGLWRRSRPEHADAVEADLTEARDEALAAAESEDERIALALTVEWESRLRRLVAADATAAAELARVVTALSGLLERTTAEREKRHENITITQDAHTSGHSTVIQVAGDARIGKVVLAPGGHDDFLGDTAR
jgi:hypothetical protein